MKHKTTVDDEAIKSASKLQRHREKDLFPEMEDPQAHANRKKAVDDGYGKEQKKEARENRERNKGLITGLREDGNE